MLHTHSQPRPETHDPRRRTETGDEGARLPEAGVDDPDHGRPGPLRNPRPKDDVQERPDGAETPEGMAPRTLH